MKCRYKEPMEYFYLTKDNYKEFLKENFSSLYINGIIENNNRYIQIKNGYFSIVFLFNYYYVYEDFNYELPKWNKYTKEEFEKKFEVVD